MAQRFAVHKLAPPDNHGALLVLDVTQPTAPGASLLGTKVLRLLLGCLLQGARRQPLRRSNGYGFHGVQVDIQTWPLVTKCAPNDDFPPLLGQLKRWPLHPASSENV